MQAKNQISTVSIIGSGNVATALSIALADCGVKIVDIFSPNIANSKLLASKIGCNFVDDIIKLNQNSDLYIIATPDKEIGNVILNLKEVTGVVVHTSGSEPITHLKKYIVNCGVFYPLQTFTIGNNVNFENIPICIEGSNESVTNMLSQLADKISNNVVVLNSEKRQYLHLTAVMVNNFTNHLYNIAHGVLLDNEIDFSLLHPLIKETASKINKVIPGDAQTGPARRKDEVTIEKHLQLLNNYPEYKKIYSLLSNQIIKKYND
ncbi:MAG: DUF2520 domain-containing protein [Bacteroidota bacterium]